MILIVEDKKWVRGGLKSKRGTVNQTVPLF
jgi:hypothetical protein